MNGYSRYDVPESKAFTCTPGILYPVRIDFINARDRVTIAQGIDVRSNPLAVPSFNPYTVRLHRFWVPLQLYHPELRVNSSKFDMNDLSLNWVPNVTSCGDTETSVYAIPYNNPSSLYPWLRINPGEIQSTDTEASLWDVELPPSTSLGFWANADTYLAYWDIVRNYYSYSQWGLYSIAWPLGVSVRNSAAATPEQSPSITFLPADSDSSFTQTYCNLEYLDAYFESQFYPSSVSSTNGTYNRANLGLQIVNSQLFDSTAIAASSGYPVASVDKLSSTLSSAPDSYFSNTCSSVNTTATFGGFLTRCHPMAVIPSNPDRFSRLIPSGSSQSVSTTGITTIPQLAIASRMQEYKDLLGAGGSRYSDWLETFFASKIEHVDRPKLLFSASQTVNVQVIMNQAGVNNFQSDGNPLGQQGGSIAFNTALGRSQSYYFREPGYMIDMLSIRPVYYWANIRPDYLNYIGSDYFNPIYNDIGYQDIPVTLFSRSIGSLVSSLAVEPCFNEFRSSYDEVMGQISYYPGTAEGITSVTPLYTRWVQQRRYTKDIFTSPTRISPFLFVDMAQANESFASNVEDNFFVNMSYSVRKKNLVNKTFATRLSNR